MYQQRNCLVISRGRVTARPRIPGLIEREINLFSIITWLRGARLCLIAHFWSYLET
jgi:hypothetical protein